jgi:hypothetical protein
MKHLTPFLRSRARPFVIALAALASITTAPIGNAADTYSVRQLFSQANAEERSGQHGPAIRDYERARLLAPRDPAIERNLRIAREKAGVAPVAVSAWERPAYALNLNALAVLASICLLLVCVLLFGTRSLATGLRGLGTKLAGVAGAVFLLAAAAIAWRWPELRRAVVLPSQAVLHLAPAAGSDDVARLQGGDLVTLQRTYGDFAYVNTTNGHGGWIPRTEIERLLPSSVHLSPNEAAR